MGRTDAYTTPHTGDGCVGDAYSMRRTDANTTPPVSLAKETGGLDVAGREVHDASLRLKIIYGTR